MIIKIIVTLLGIWILFAIIIPFLTMPNFYLIKLKPQHSKYIEQTARKLKAKTKEQTLKNIFKFVTTNYTGRKEKYKLAIYYNLFNSNVDKNLKKKKQFLACHLQNFIISTLLKKTKQFTNKDIEERIYVTRYITIHQDLIIKIDNKKFHIDPFYREFKLIKTR